MAIKYKVTKAEYDGLDEGIRGLYRADGDGYVLDAEGVEDPRELKSALAKERQSRADAEKMLKAWNQTGKKPEEISEILRKAEEEEQRRLEKDGDFKKITAQMKEKHAEEINALKQEITSFKDKYTQREIDATATAAISEAKGNTKLLLPLVKAVARLVEDEGKEFIRIIGEDGAPRLNGKGEYMSIAEYIADLKKDPDFQGAFSASGAKGGGAQGSNGGGAGGGETNPWAKETFNLTKQGQIFREDPTKARSLAAAAGIRLP